MITTKVEVVVDLEVSNISLVKYSSINIFLAVDRRGSINYYVQSITRYHNLVNLHQ